MEFSTKKIFTPPLKNNSKTCIRSSYKFKFSLQNSKSKFSINSCKEKIIFKKKLTKKINPFHNTISKTKFLSKQKVNKFLNVKKNTKQNLKFIYTKDMFEGSYIDNLFSTNESDSYKLEDTLNEAEPNPNKYFKKSNLKSTIIIDNNGNNNLDLEQKKFIYNYLNKKFDSKTKKINNNNNHTKINSIPVQKYKENNILFKNQLIKKKNEIKKKKKTQIVNPQEIFALLQNNNKINKENNLTKNKKQKNEKDKYSKSNFEVCTDFSLDSSFLGSSLNDNFYQELIGKKNCFK